LGEQKYKNLPEISRKTKVKAFNLWKEPHLCKYFHIIDKMAKFADFSIIHLKIL
jgi:hypothetical protein